jgi:FkbH-like protein
VQTGLFDDLIGSIRRVANVTAAVVVIEWADLDPRLGLRRAGGWDPSQLPDILSEASRSCELLQKAMVEAGRDIPVIVCFPTLPLPPVSFTSGVRASEFALELRGRVAALGAELSHQPGIRVLDHQRIDAASSSRRRDVNSELAAGFPYTLPHASVLAGLLAELVLNRRPKKGLITDLDDTLWRGILGEVGVQGISWDLDNHSQIHALYQQLLHSLAASGTLVAVASKNERVLVKEAFASRELILSAADVFPFEVHWNSKSESVTRILMAWNISADDVVCVDDSPMDLAEIKAVHPDAECLLFPSENPQGAYELLEQLRDLFGKEKILEEDSLRASSWRANKNLHDDQRSSPAASDEFIRQIDGKLTLSSKKHPLDSRSLELVNKTNQFNLNGRRFLESEWQSLLSAPNSVLLSASYRDKYGPLGKIAVIAGDLISADATSGNIGTPIPILRIRTWVMSCRAFSRMIEYECICWLFDKLDVQEVEFDFLPTPRNTPMQNFLQRVLNARAEPHCRLTRKQFTENSPATAHAIEELLDG